MDEVLGLPTAKAAHVALRTQQIIAHETGIADIVEEGIARGKRIKTI